MTVKRRIEAAEKVASAKAGAVGRLMPCEIKTIARGIELAEANTRTAEESAELVAIESRLGCNFVEVLRFLDEAGA